jgi:hypothetical protein
LEKGIAAKKFFSRMVLAFGDMNTRIIGPSQACHRTLEKGLYYLIVEFDMLN